MRPEYVERRRVKVRDLVIEYARAEITCNEANGAYAQDLRWKADEAYALVTEAIDAYAADQTATIEVLEQLEREMAAGFGSSFGETRERVRRVLHRLKTTYPTTNHQEYGQ